MTSRQTERRPRWWPPFSEWFEDLPLDLRSGGEHPIRVEESREEGAYTVRAELPGVDPDKDIEITVDGGVLTVHAERAEEKKDKERSEFRYGSFTRSVQLPPGVDENDVTATYDNGVLTVTAPVPVPVRTEPHRVRITKE
ncbi:Hsp20/alpha crystallin family protein [Actinacidiphila acidipaludis]|uniref:Hsp20/alpha crystallin family protein n=1 Tax=Actinacidiphila acidipaludis TaxID=2873382 RepID=A0ABS7QEN2_9ACTN|nr:Hsp20/alpha crystallin family protein [Streptomyces acidipaludis]MBY8880214.1 Hsp20/alpha crystallin family protein [Streptomyces acidipaludis]